MTFGTFQLRSKHNDSASFSKEEIKLFSQIYSYKLNHPFNKDVVKQKASKLFNCPEKRLNEIINAEINNKTVRFTKDEKRSVSKLKMIVQTEKDKHDMRVNAYLRSININKKTFCDMEHTFTENKKFKSLVLNYMLTL